MPPSLQIQNLTKAYPIRTLLQNVQFQLEAGARVLLCGPSGSGKSTLLRLIAGLEAPDQGEIRISGTTASNGRRVLVPPHKRRLAVVFQDLGLWPNLSAWNNVMLGLSSSKLSKTQKRERTSQALQLCRIGGLGKRRPSDLSGGEQQRVALARALAVQPRLLLLDEPCNGLDMALRHAFLRQVVELSDEMGTAVLLVSHNLHDAQVIRGDLAVLEEGKLELYRTVEQVRVSSLATLRTWREEFGTERLFLHGQSWEQDPAAVAPELTCRLNHHFQGT